MVAIAKYDVIHVLCIEVENVDIPAAPSIAPAAYHQHGCQKEDPQDQPAASLPQSFHERSSSRQDASFSGIGRYFSYRS